MSETSQSKALTAAIEAVEAHIAVTADSMTAAYRQEMNRLLGELRRSAGALDIASTIGSADTAATGNRPASPVGSTTARRAMTHEFLANFSHEIRTPMTSILGFAELLREGSIFGLSSAQRIEAVSAILASGHELLQIVDDILDLSRLDAHSMEFERAPFAPLDVLADIQSLLSVRASAKGLRFRLDFDGPVPATMIGDRVRIRQVVKALVSNAIKFTEVDGVTVRTSLVDGDATSARLRVDVIDTGVGIAPADALRIFEPFDRVDTSFARNEGGCGLGLAISHRLANAMGGLLELVESRLGSGSHFRFEVPTGSLAGIERIAAPEREISIRKPATATNLSIGQLRCSVLLAEDGPDNRRLISLLLRKLGASVVVVENGQEAVAEALKARGFGRPFDLILMDMQMPIKDGYCATRELRAAGYGAPILAVTAHALSEDRQKCLDAGCNDYCSKPIDRSKLVQLINRYVHGGEAGYADDPLIDAENRRVLIIDDNEMIRNDFGRILQPSEDVDTDLNELEATIFGNEEPAARVPVYHVEGAAQGRDGFEMVRAARDRGEPYAVVFVDMRMPPGWDGLETVQRIWEIDDAIQTVICTAFSDYSWAEITDRLGPTHRLLILKKPVDTTEVLQVVSALTEKWAVQRNAEYRIDRLHQLVSERTREFEQSRVELRQRSEELAIATAEADKAKSVKDHVVTSMNHEIRAPMTSILGFAQLLLDGQLDNDLEGAERVDAIAAIRLGGVQLLDSLNEILDLSRIEAGYLEVACVSCSPKEVAQEVYELFRSQASAKGLSLVLEIPRDAPTTIQTDPQRLQQILRHLVGNAIKFTHTGAIAIELSFNCPGFGDDRMEIAVTDTGVGIPDAQLRTLFELPSRRHDSLRVNALGQGLGVTLCRRLARLLGGDLHVTSSVGRGTTFTVSVPTGLIAVRQGSTVETLAAGLNELAGIRVLLVEDGVDNQRLIRLVLGVAGAAVSVAENGRVGVDAAVTARDAGMPYDVVIMDVQMPVMDGVDATRELRRLGFQCPILALTAHALKTDRERCLAAGCNDYATKPIDRQLLCFTIRSLIENQRQSENDPSASR